MIKKPKIISSLVLVSNSWNRLNQNELKYWFNHNSKKIKKTNPPPPFLSASHLFKFIPTSYLLHHILFFSWHQIHELYHDLVCLTENSFLETTFQTFPCLFIIRKVGQRKTLSSQRKSWLGFQESVFLLFWAENTFQKLWKI